MRSIAGMLLQVLVCVTSIPGVIHAQSSGSAALDQRIQQFLDGRRGAWRDSNVSEADGRILHDLIVERGFRHAVEIGTSTGHSGIWLGRALARTGGRLITVEIDARRHRVAVDNFKAAGLADLIDARLGDAHQLVPQLDDPIDFVFSDADNEWYRNYFVALWPKITPGGCFTAHNVTGNMRGIREFLDHLKTVPDATTSIDRRSRSGISVTCKRKD